MLPESSSLQLMRVSTQTYRAVPDTSQAIGGQRDLVEPLRERIGEELSLTLGSRNEVYLNGCSDYSDQNCRLSSLHLLFTSSSSIIILSPSHPVFPFQHSITTRWTRVPLQMSLVSRDWHSVRLSMHNSQLLASMTDPTVASNQLQARPKFGFLDLPAEVRFIIYRLMFVSPVFAEFSSESSSPLRLGFRSPDDQPSGSSDSHTYNGLPTTFIVTCRQVSEEVLPIVYGENDFIVYDPIEILERLISVVGTKNASLIQRLHLTDFGIPNLGVHGETLYFCALNYLVAVLRSFGGLNHLTLMDKWFDEDEVLRRFQIQFLVTIAASLPELRIFRHPISKKIRFLEPQESKSQEVG